MVSQCHLSIFNQDTHFKPYGSGPLLLFPHSQSSSIVHREPQYHDYIKRWISPRRLTERPRHERSPCRVGGGLASRGILWIRWSLWITARMLCRDSEREAWPPCRVHPYVTLPVQNRAAYSDGDIINSCNESEYDRVLCLRLYLLTHTRH